MHTGRASRVRTRAVLVTLAMMAATAVVAWVAIGTYRGQIWDYTAFMSAAMTNDGRYRVLSLLGYVSIGGVLALCAVCVLIALLRGSWRLAAGSLVIIGGANVTTQVLKHLALERSDFGIWLGFNSLPSGHVTVVASGAGALLLIAPGAWRLAASFVAALFVTLTGSSTVLAGWHRPADIIASLTVTLAWTAAVAAVVGGFRTRRSWPAMTLPAIAGSLLAAAALVVIGARPTDGLDGLLFALAVHGSLVLAVALFVIVAEWVTPSQRASAVRVARAPAAAHAPAPV